MRAIQEVIRLHAASFSQRTIAQAWRLFKGAVGKYLQKAKQTSLMAFAPKKWTRKNWKCYFS